VGGGRPGPGEEISGGIRYRSDDGCSVFISQKTARNSALPSANFRFEVPGGVEPV